jgi:hypothetical protein
MSTDHRHILIATVLALATAGCRERSKKPIIYLYPEATTEVSVRFTDPDSVELTSTYPDYGADGWEVVAEPDGTLFDPVTGEEFYALYWEGLTDAPRHLETGAVVAANDTEDFLEEALADLGLTPREANEFIIYWAPILEESRHNFVHFSTDGWDDRVPLDIDPAPDSLIRVMMYYRPCSRSMKVEPQEFSTPTREGFTVVEWGGTRLPRQ